MGHNPIQSGKLYKNNYIYKLKIYENVPFALQNWWKQWTTLFHLRWSLVASMQVHPPLMDVPHIADGVTQPQTVTADQDQTELLVYYNCFGAIGFFHET